MIPPNKPIKPIGNKIRPPRIKPNPGIIKPKPSNCNPRLNNNGIKLNKNNGNDKRLIINGNKIKPMSGIAIASFNSIGKIIPLSNIKPRAINGRTNTFKSKNGTSNGSNALPNAIKPTNGNVIRCANKLFNNINGNNAKNVNPLANNGKPSTRSGVIRIFRGRINKSNRSLSTPGKAKSIANVSPNNLNPLTKLLNTTIGKMIKAGMLARTSMMPRLIKIGNIALSIGNVIKVKRPKFNKNNGNVSNAVINGNANNPKIFNPVLIIGNNTGSNGQNNGLSIVNNVNSPSAGIARALNKSIGKANNGPRISFKTSASLNGINIPSAAQIGNSNGSNGHVIGLRSVNNMLRPMSNGNPNNPSKSNGNLINPFKAPNANGIKLPNNNANGNASNALARSINGNNNKSNKSLTGKLPSNANNGNNNVNQSGKLNNIIANVTNGNTSKKLINAANNGRPNNNSGKPTNLNKSLNSLNGRSSNSNPSNAQKATLLKILSRGKLNHRGNVNKANANGIKFLKNFNAALIKLIVNNVKNVNACASNGNNRCNKLPSNTLPTKLNKNIGLNANKSSNGNPRSPKTSKIKFAIGYVSNPANAPHRSGAIRFLKVSSNNGKPNNCVNNNNGIANKLIPGINEPSNANKLSNGRPSNPRISSGNPPKRPLNNGVKIAAIVAGIKLVNKFNKMSPGTKINLANNLVLNVLSAAIAGTRIQLIGFKNCNGPKIGNNNKFVNPATNNGRTVFFNRSHKNLSGNVNKFNSDKILINAGMKNNASMNKSKNGINPGNARSPNKMNLLNVLIASISNLSRFANTMIGLSNNPIKTGKKFATNADNPFAIKNGKTLLAIGNVNNVNNAKLMKNNGNVRSNVVSGNSNKANSGNAMLRIGNANNVPKIASGRPSNNSFARSPNVLMNANGIAIKSLNSLSGSKNGINNNPNPGINIAKVLNNCTSGRINNRFNRSNGKFPRRSLRTSANANAVRPSPNGNSNGVNKLSNGMKGNNNVNNPSPNNLRRSNGNFNNLNSPASNNGNNKPAKIANGNASKKLPNNTNGNNNKSNKSLIGITGNNASNGNNNDNQIGNDKNMLINASNGRASNNVARPANSGSPNNNSGNPSSLKALLSKLSNVNNNAGKINNLLNKLSAGNPSQIGDVNSARAKFNRFKPSLINLLRKLNNAKPNPVSNPASNGKPNNNNGRRTNAKLNRFNKNSGNAANNPRSGNNRRSRMSLITLASGYVNNAANPPHRSGAIKFLKVSNNSGKPSN